MRFSELLFVAAMLAACEPSSVLGLDAGHVGRDSSAVDSSLEDVSNRRDGDSDATPADAGLSFDSRCEDAYGVRICTHIYLASATDPAIRDVHGTAGVGRNVVCYPEDASAQNARVLLHLVGTGDIPARSIEYLKFACSLGYVVIAPMYENENASRTTCGTDSACYENLRHEVIYGGDFAADPIVVDEPNSIFHRVEATWTSLSSRDAARWTEFATAFTSRDLSPYVLSGHSQGAGHVLMIARDHPVNRVLMLSGITDRLKMSVDPSSRVEWISAWDSLTSMTSASSFYSFNHQDDTFGVFEQINDNYDAIGMADTRCDASGAAFTPDCRRLEISAEGCLGLLAHSVVTLPSFGTRALPCSFDGAEHSNLVAWGFLLRE